MANETTPIGTSPFEGMDNAQLQQLITELLQLLQASGVGAPQDPMSTAAKQLAMMKQLTGRSSGGAIGQPLAGSTMMQSATPSGGPVQWLGGMPPGYDDKVARKLSYGALAGNLGAGDAIMSGLGGLLKGLFGGGSK